MECTVRTIHAMIDTLAPFDTALAFDNVGLLVGRMDQPVHAVLTALDATPAVVREARDLGAELLVAHHPLMFSPINRLDEANPEAVVLCDMVRAGISMIAAHTNLDRAHGGVNDTLARQLGWPVSAIDDFLRLGHWDTPQRLDALQAAAESALHTQAWRFGAADRMVRRFAICSGAGSSEVENAARAGADILLTGEIKHSAALEALQRGMAVLACGHYATEICAAELLRNHLQSAVNAVELKVRVFASQIDLLK